MINKPLEIALVCNRSTGVAILGRVITLFKYKKIKASYTIIISSSSSIKEVNDLMPKNIEYKIIKISSLLEKIYKMKSFISKSEIKVDLKNSFYIKPRKIFNLRSLSIVFLKIFIRIIDILYLKTQFKNLSYDYALFHTDHTNNILMHLIGIFKRKKTITILPELAYPSLTWKLQSRKKQLSNYVEENGLFSYLFSDQKLNSEKDYMLTFFSPEETIALFFTGVLPRYPKKILGSLCFDKILLSSDDLYKNSVLSPFTKSSTIYKSLSINEEIVLISKKRRKSIRNNLCKKYKLQKTNTIILYSITNLEHTNFFTEKESEEIQLRLINKIIKINPKSLIMFHPSMKQEKYQKIRKIYRDILVDEPLPYIASSIDVFVSLTETSAEQYLLPLGIECIIFYFNKSWLYGIYDHYKNLNCFKINDYRGLHRIRKLKELNFINDMKSNYPGSNIKSFTDCFFD